MDAIWDFIARYDLEATERFTATLAEKFFALSAEPGMGRASSELGFGLRRFPAGNYLIFYRPTASHVEIVRVLHGAREIETFFEPGDEAR